MKRRPKPRHDRRRNRVRSSRRVRFEQLEDRRLLATIVWDGEGGDNSWHTPANWFNETTGQNSNDFLPGPDDDVEIRADFSGLGIDFAQTATVHSLLSEAGLSVRAGTLSLAADSEIRGHFALTGNDFHRGALSGSGVLTVSGGMTWERGADLAGTGVLEIAAGSSLEIQRNVDLRDTRVINNFGTIEWVDHSIQVFDQPQINIMPGGVFDILSGTNITRNAGSSGVINNHGQVRKSSGGVSKTTIPFNSTGEVNVLSGRLDLAGGGASRGSFTIDATGELAFGGGSHTVTLDSESGISGEGKVSHWGASTATTIQGGGTIDVTSLYVQGGTLALNVEASVEQLEITSGFNQKGHLTGAGDLTVTGSMLWEAGEVSGTGELNIPADATLTIDDDYGVVSQSRVINVAGTHRMLRRATLQMRDDAQLNILPEGVLDLQTTGDGIRRENGNTPATINNEGLVRRSSTGQTAISAYFYNNGTVQVDSGVLDIGGGGSSTGGDFLIDSGAELIFSPTGGQVAYSRSYAVTLDPENAITGDGKMTVTADLTVQGEGTFDVESLVLVGGILRLDVDGATRNLQIVPNGNRSTSGHLSGSGTLEVSDSMSWSAGDLSGSGHLILGPVAQSTISGSGYTAKPLDNFGTLDWVGGTIITRTGAELNNQPGALFDIRDDLWLAREDGNVVAVFNNEGTLRRSNAAGTATIQIPLNNWNDLQAVAGGMRFDRGFHQWSGNTQLDGGSLEFTSSSSFDGGRITGSGTLAGSVMLGRVAVEPGTDATAGQISFTTSLAMSSDTRLALDLFGSGPDQVDRVMVSGTLTLGGTLALLPISGFDEPPGTEYVIVTAGTRSGNFDSVIGDYLDVTRRLDLVQDETAVKLVVSIVDQAAVANELRDDWNAGIAALRAALPSWGTALDSHGQDLAVVPDSLATDLDVGGLLGTWAAGELVTIDPQAVLNTLEDLRQLFLDAGYSQVCILGDPDCGTEPLQISLDVMIADLSSGVSYNDATTSLLTGLATGAEFDGPLQAEGVLHGSWTLGVDSSDFYIRSHEFLALEAVVTGALTGSAPLPGDVFSLETAEPQPGEAGSQAAASATLQLMPDWEGQRLRPGQFANAASVLGASAAGSASIVADWNLQAHTVPLDLEFSDRWDVMFSPSSYDVVPQLAEVTADDFLHAATSLMSNTLKQFIVPEMVAGFEELVLPLTGALVPSPVQDRERGAVVSDALWWDQLAGWMSQLLDFSNDPSAQGTFYTEGDSLLQADVLRQRTGLSGEGVTIGVLSDGVTHDDDNSPGTAALDRAIATGDLPAVWTEYTPDDEPSVRPLRKGSGAEGVAMMEIIHDIAPGAQLLFYGVGEEEAGNPRDRWDENIARGVRALAEAGADIIVDDVFSWDGPWFSPSSIGVAFQAVLDNFDTLLVSAAGNEGAAHYQSLGQWEQRGGQSLHVFDPDATGDARYVLEAVARKDSDAHWIELQWDDNFALPTSQLVLQQVDFDVATGTINGVVDESAASQNASVDLAFALDAGAPAYFVVDFRSSEDPNYQPTIEMFGGDRLLFTVTESAAEDALFGQNAIPGVLSVGSVNADTPDEVASYSNAGGSTFRGLPPAPTLDVLAFDKVDVSGAGGFGRPFQGTSAAAPHAAAVAALLAELLAGENVPRELWRARITDALQQTAETFSGEEYTNQEGYGLINALRAAEHLAGIPPAGDPPVPPVRTPATETYSRLGMSVNVAGSDAIRAFLSGDDSRLALGDLVTVGFALSEGDIQPIEAAFNFDLERDVLGQLDQFGLTGAASGALSPEAHLQFGIDTAGGYLDPVSYVGGHIVIEPEGKGEFFSSSVELSGRVEANPAVTFLAAAGRLRPADATDHLANDLRFELRPISSESAATIAGNVNAELVLGFLDYVDVDSLRPNSDNGGDPFRVSGSAGLSVVLPDLSPPAFQNIQFVWTDLELRNPDVDQNGVPDYTAGVFLANAMEFGWSLLEGTGVAEYLSGLAGDLTNASQQAFTVDTQPRGALPESIPPTDASITASESLRDEIENGASDPSGAGIVDAVTTWLLGAPDAPPSVTEQFDELNNATDPSEYAANLVNSLGDLLRIKTTIDWLWGGVVNAPAALEQGLQALLDVVPERIAQAVRQAHDDAIELYHSGAPARADGMGYLDRALEAYQWATTASYLHMSPDPDRPELSPRYVIEHFPVQVVIDRSELRALTAEDGDGLLGVYADGTYDEAQLVVKAGLKVKKPGVSLDADPADETIYADPIYDSGALVVRSRGRDNNNVIGGAPAIENSTLDKLLELAGLPGIDWFDSENENGWVEHRPDTKGEVRTSVSLGAGDTLAQVEFSVGLTEFPLAESKSNVVLGRPYVELRAGTGGVGSVTEDGVVVGPGQSALLEATVMRGRGPLKDQSVTFYLLNEGDAGSFREYGEAVKTYTAVRTTPDGKAYAVYFPPEEAVDAAAIGAVYFENGRAYTAATGLEVVTSQADFALVADQLAPALLRPASSTEAEQVRDERQRLLQENGGQINDAVRDGLVEVVGTWYENVVGDSLLQAEQREQDYQASTSLSFEQLRNRYVDAENETRRAGEELLEWLATIKLLGLNLSSPISDTNPTTLQVYLDAAVSSYRTLIQQAIERNLDFLAKVQQAIAAQQIPPTDELVGTQPMSEALRWSASAEQFVTLTEDFYQQDQLERRVPWDAATIVDQAGLQVQWTDGPSLGELGPNTPVSGALQLQITLPGSDTTTRVMARPGMPAPVEVRLRAPGHAIAQQSFAVGSTFENAASGGGHVLVPTSDSFETTIAFGPDQIQMDVDVDVYLGEYLVETKRVSRAAEPLVELAGRSGGGLTFLDYGVVIEEGIGELQVDLQQGNGKLAGQEVQLRVIGQGRLSQIAAVTDDAGLVPVTFTPPTFDSLPPDMSEYGTSTVTVTYTGAGQTYTDSLIVTYRNRVSADAVDSFFDTPDQQRASEALAELIALHTEFDAETSIPVVDMVAVRQEAVPILVQWWGTPDDYDPATHEPDAIGSVLYWLEHARHVPAVAQDDWNTAETQFDTASENALGNWGQWFAALDWLELESVPGVDVQAARDRIRAMLLDGVDRIRQRCEVGASRYLAATDPELKQFLLEQLVDVGTDVFQLYEAGRRLGVLDATPETLEQIVNALCFRPDISQDETQLLMGGSNTTAQLEFRAGIRVGDLDELLYVDRLPVVIRSLVDATGSDSVGATDRDGYYRQAIELAPGQSVVEVDVLLAWGDITFAETRVRAEAQPQLDLLVARESDGPAALSPVAPRVFDGEPLIVEVRLTRGRAPMAGQMVFVNTLGATHETGGMELIQHDGTARVMVTPSIDETTTLQIGVAYEYEGQPYTRSLSVPIIITHEEGRVVRPYSAAHVEAEARIGRSLSQSVLDAIGDSSNEDTRDFEPDLDVEELTAALEFWLNAGLQNPDEPRGLQLRINEAVFDGTISSADEAIDLIEGLIIEYDRWLGAAQQLGVVEQSVRAAIGAQVRQRYQEAVERALQLVWDPDPGQAGEAPSGYAAQKLMMLASQAVIDGLDRGGTEDEGYSLDALLQRTGYELRIDNIQLDGIADDLSLTIDANLYLFSADPGPGGTGADKVKAEVDDRYISYMKVAPFNATLGNLAQRQELTRGGRYFNKVQLAPDASEVVLDVVAIDPVLDTDPVWKRQVRLPAEYRFEARGRILGDDNQTWTKGPVASSHADSLQQVLIRGELLKGNGLLEGQQIAAEAVGEFGGTIQRDGDAGDRFIYTPPTGQDGSDTIRLKSLLNGQPVQTEITITYRDEPAQSSSNDDGSLWGWIARQFDALTTPLGDASGDGTGVGSAFGLEDIQFPSLGGSFNRAAGYAGGLLDWSLGAFDVLGTIDLQSVLDWLQNGPPTDTRDLIRMSLDLNSISQILSPTLLAADFTDLLPDGFSGNVRLDRPELTGQIVFGIDTSADPFYILTRADDFSFGGTGRGSGGTGFASEDNGTECRTTLGARFGVYAEVDSDAEFLDGLLGLDHAEGYLSAKVKVDWSDVAAADGKLRLSNLPQLANLRVGFDGNPLDSFQMTLGGHATVPGLSGTGDESGDPLLQLSVAGAVYKPSLDTLDPGQLPPRGDLPLVFELRTGSLHLEPSEDLQHRLATANVFLPGTGTETDDAHEFNGDWRNITTGSPGDLGTPQQLTTVEALTLRDSADWFGFTTTSRGTATSYVQVDFAHERGDLDLELYRLGVNDQTGEPQAVLVRGDALAFGDRARLTLLGQPAGTYFVRVSDDSGGRSPYYALTVKPPTEIEPGITANIDGFELRDTGVAFTVDSELNFDAQLAGRLLIPYSLQDDVPTEFGFQAQINNEGLSGRVFTEIGNDAVLTRREPLPASGAVSVEIDPGKGGLVIFDYQSVDRFKFAGLELTGQGPRWVIGQYEVVEIPGDTEVDTRYEGRWHRLTEVAAQQLPAPGTPLSIQVKWKGGNVVLGTGAGSSYLNRLAYDFHQAMSGGLAGLGTTANSAWFGNYRIWAEDVATGELINVHRDTLAETLDQAWQVQRGGWQPENGGLSGKPTEIRLGQWLLIDRAKLEAVLDIDFNDSNILAPPDSIAAGISITDLNALVYEVGEGGTPLYPERPDSPEGLVAIEGGFGSISTSGVSLGADRISAGIKDVLFVDMNQVEIDLAGGGDYFLKVGGADIRVPFFGDEPVLSVSDTDPTDEIPLFGVLRPVFNGDQLVENAKLAFGQAVGGELNISDLLDEFSLRDVLPLSVERVYLEFPDTQRLDSFELAVDARFNLYELDENGDPVLDDNNDPIKRGIFSLLPFDPILAVGRPAGTTCSGGSVIDWPELENDPDIDGLTLCENGFVSVHVVADSLLSPNRQLRFKELGPVYIGARDFPIPVAPPGVDNLQAAGAIYLGKLDENGDWDGKIGGTFTVYDADDPENLEVRASAVGELSVLEPPGETVTSLNLDWVVEATAQNQWLGITEGNIQLHTELVNTATAAQPWDLSFSAELTSFDTGLIEIHLGEYFTLFGQAEANLEAGPDEPFFILRSAGVRVEEAAPDTLQGLTFEAGGFGVSANFGQYFLLAPEAAVDDPTTTDYDESLGAYFRIAIDEGSDAPSANIFGLPEWFPLQITEVGIRFKGEDGYDADDDGQADDLDVTLEQVLTEPDQQFYRLVDDDNFNLIVSGGFQSSDVWPIRAQIKKLEIDLGKLVTYVSNPCQSTGTLGTESCPIPFDLNSVTGASVALQPVDLGPLTVGGGLGFGLADVELESGETRQVLYGQILGELGVAGIGVGAEIIVTQYGPVLARINAGAPIPIGGIVGAAVGTAFFPALGTAAGFQVGNQTGFIITGLEGALVFDSPDINEIPNPLDILDNPEFARPRNMSPQEIEAAITKIVRVNDGRAPDDLELTWDKGFRLVGTGVLTNTNVYNAIGGRVTIGLNVGYDEATLEGLSQSNAQVFVRGDLEVLGQSLAQADIVFDMSDPLNPTLNLAAGIPGSGGVLSLLFPIQARIGAQFDTDGLAAGTVVAARTFFEEIINATDEYFGEALALLADKYESERRDFLEQLARAEAHRDRLQRLQTLDNGSSAYDLLIDDAQQTIDDLHAQFGFFKVLLDTNHDRQLQNEELGGTENDVITPAFLRQRLLGDGQIPAAIPSIDTLEDLEIDDLRMGVMVAGRLLSDMLQIAPQLEVEAPLPDTGDEQLNELIRELFAEGTGRAGDLANSHLDLLNGYIDPVQLATMRNAAAKSAEMTAAIAAIVFSIYGAAAEEATNAFFGTINPSLSIEGHVQPMILGMPVGQPREKVHVRIDKTRLETDLKVRLIEQIGRLATQGLLAMSPITDVTELEIQVPFENLYKDLFLGRVPQVDLSGPSTWYVGLGTALDYFGFQLAQARGYIFPGPIMLEGSDVSTGAEYLQKEFKITPTPGQATEGLIYVDDQLADQADLNDPPRTNWEKIQGGGILIDGRLTLPRFLTEPIDLFTEVYTDLETHMNAIGVNCGNPDEPPLSNVFACVMAHPQETFAFLRKLFNVPDQVTALQQVAQLQMYVPDLFTPIIDSLGGIETLRGLDADDLAEQIAEAAKQLGEELADIYERDGYVYGQYGDVTIDGNPQATTSKLLGVEMGEAIIRGRGDQLEIIGDFLGIETHFFVDLNDSGQEQYVDENESGQYDLAEPFVSEPFTDQNEMNGTWDDGEPYEDLNGNGVWDADWGDFDGDGVWDRAETWTDFNGNGIVDDAEPFEDLNGNKRWDAGEPWTDLDEDGQVDIVEYRDLNRNGRYDGPEPWEDLNENGIWDQREWVELNGPPPGGERVIFDAVGDEFVDLNHDGVRQSTSDIVVPNGNDDGDDQLDLGLPRLAAEVILGHAPAGTTFSLPNTYTVDNAADQFRSFLAAIGLADYAAAGGFLQLREGAGTGAALSVYSPGYSYEPAAPEIERRGGIQMIADVEIPDFIEDATFDFQVSLPESGFVPGFVATATAERIGNPGGFFLPSISGLGLELRHEPPALPGEVGTVTFGIQESTFELLGQTFTLAPISVTLGQSGEGEFGEYYLQPEADGIHGRLQLVPPSSSNGLLSGPVQIDGTYALSFDTRPGQESIAIEVTHGTLSIYGYALTEATFTLMVGADGSVTLSDLQADSPLFGPFGDLLDFDGSLTVLPPLPGSDMLRLAPSELSVPDIAVVVAPAPGFAELNGTAAITVDQAGFSGQFSGNATILGVQSPSANGSIDTFGCVDVAFDAGGQHYQQFFELPGGNCGMASSQVQVDLGPAAEIELSGGPPTLDGLDHLLMLEGSGGTTRIRIPVTLRSLVPADADTTVTVSYSVTPEPGGPQPGIDYQVLGGGSTTLTVGAGQDQHKAFIEIDIISDTDFEQLNESFEVRITVDQFLPPENSDAQLYEGQMSVMVTMQNDDEPSLQDYPNGVLRAPDNSLAFWNFDQPGPDGFDFTVKGVDLPVSFAATDFEFSDKASSVRGLPGVVRDQGRIWFEASRAATQHADFLSIPYYEFTVEPNGTILSYDPERIQFYTFTDQGHDDWELSWSIDGSTFHPITSSDEHEPDLTYQGWSRYNVELPALTEVGADGIMGTNDDKTYAFFAQPLTFRLRNVHSTDHWRVDNLSVLGDYATTTEEMLLELEQFLDGMNTALPYDTNILGPGMVQAGIGPEVLVDGTPPQEALFMEVFGTDLAGTTIELDPAPPGGGRQVPFVLRTAGDVFSVDTYDVGQFHGRIDIGGAVSSAVYTGGFADGTQILVNDSTQHPLNIYGDGNWGTPGNNVGVHLRSNSMLSTLLLVGNWNSGQLRGSAVGNVDVFGDFTGGMTLTKGFEQFRVTGGDFAPSRFSTGNGNLSGRRPTGGSGELVVVSGDLRGSLQIGGGIDLVKVDSGDMDVELMAQHIGDVVSVTHASNLIGGDVLGTFSAQTISRFDITGGDLRASITTLDATSDDSVLDVRSYQGKGGGIYSPGSIHIAGGVSRISANDILMGLHVDGYVESIVVNPAPGATGSMRGNWDAGSFGAIEAHDAIVDIDITVKHESWQLGDELGIGSIELKNSTWAGGSINLPPGVVTGPITVDGQILDWQDPTGLPLPDGYRLEVVGSGLERRAFVVPASWQNPRNRFDVTDDGYVSPLDVLTIIRDLNTRGARLLDPPSLLSEMPAPFIDVTGDGYVSPLDVLRVIEWLNASGVGGEAEGGEDGGGRVSPSVERAGSAVLAAKLFGPSTDRAYEIPGGSNPTTSAAPLVDGQSDFIMGGAAPSEYEASVRRVFAQHEELDDEFWSEVLADL